MPITREAALRSLEAVTHPNLQRPLAELGMLKGVDVDPRGRVSVTVVVGSPATTLRPRLTEAIEAALRAAGASSIAVAWDGAVLGRDVLADDPVPGVKNVILVMSGKGGVGKSTVAANLTMALARSGAKVGLLDADMYGPSIPTMFGLHDRPSATDDQLILPL